MSKGDNLLTLLLLFLSSSKCTLASLSNACYDDTGPVACFPPFVNPAFNRLFTVSNTCGEKAREHFCLQMVISGEEKWCDDCDATDESKAHHPKFLTDHNTPQNLTWWQSSTMLAEDIQYPNSVNLTLGLGKTFEITYIRLKFRSSRPESFAIYKKVREDQEWLPFQYYSSTCEGTYGISPGQPLTDDQATCRDDFSDISPLTEGTVAFSSLENRPSAYHYKDSPMLHEWVTAKYIMISLDRLNTFRDEVFGDPLSLSSYFYAISDISMGGRCKCNGHAKECVISGDELQCVCQHNTGGVDCDRCLPFFNDQPWKRSLVGQPYECKPCNCNGLSETCEFDPDLYHRTGHGGRCTNCRENAGGPHCDECKVGFFMDARSKKCLYCGCHDLGSEHPQCDVQGRCRCRPGVTGDKCDQCLPYHFNLSSQGCTKCQCHPSGIMPGTENFCDSVTGHCHCKLHVGGRDCDQCIGGHYGLSEDNPLGCTACFCHGHSSECNSASNYMVSEIRSTFRTSKEGWQGISPSNELLDVEHLDVTREISLVSNDDQTYYFLAPGRFLGDLRNSHNLRLSFDLRIEGGHGSPFPSSDDVILQSSDGRKLSVPIFIQNNKVPGTDRQHYSFLIGGHEFYGWNPPKVNSVDFGRFLSNISAIKIRANYVPQGMAFLSNVTLESLSSSSGVRPAIVEACVCPEGYMGQFCEACLPGYKRYPPHSGSFGTCVPCQCNGHSDSCEMESGRCICQHNTVGLNCEHCADGYFGNALNGTEDDCQPCLCPNGGRCTQLLFGGEIVCLDCDEGYGGQRCDSCVDGYYRNRDGSCVACDCNNNTDPNAVGTCNRETGECMKCLYNTTGSFCHNCLKGFYGEPTKTPHGECFHCDCNDYGSVPLDEEADGTLTREELAYGGRGHACNPWDGQCRCRPNVNGRSCDRCIEGTWGLYSRKGCEDCQCNPIGSFNSSCDTYSGQCHCKPGVTGLKCDQCQRYHYGFSPEGCHECRCNYYGSLNDTCDLVTGACLCRPKYVGRSCDQCDVNYHNLAAGCEECPVCYQLLLEPYHEIRKKISEMHTTVDQAANLPAHVAEDDEEFKGQLESLQQKIRSSENLLEGDGSFDDTRFLKNMTESMENLNRKFESVVFQVSDTEKTLTNMSNLIKTGEELAEAAADELERSKVMVKDRLEVLLSQLKQEQDKSGSQSNRMTQIAQEGRDQVDRLEEVIRDIQNTSSDAEKKSREVLELTNSMQENKTKLESELRDILLMRDHVKYQHERTVNSSAQSQVKATEALREASDLLKDVEDISVEVNLEETNTSSLFEGLQDLRKQLEEHVQSEQELLSDLKFREFDLHKGHLRQVIDQRRDLSNFANSSLNESLGARERTEKIVVEAQDILKNLQSFDENVKTHLQESEKAKLLVSDVQKNIQDADNFTALAEFELDREGAARNAEEADRVSVMALIQVYNSTEEIKRMTDEVNEIQESWDKIKESKNSDMEKVLELEDKMKKAEEEVQEEGMKLDKLLDGLNETTYSLAEQRRNITESTYKVQQFLAKLGLVRLIDDEKLQNLEDQLSATETILAASEIDRKYQDVESALLNIRGLVGNLESELMMLQTEVKELEIISDAIPDRCFREVTLEPGV